VLLRIWDDGGRPVLAFIPADVALRLTTLSSLTEVPGTRPPAKGIALAGDAVVTVLEIGKPAPAGSQTPRYRPGEDWPVPGADHAVLCAIRGQHVALTGGTVLATGLFDADGAEDGVLWRGELVRTLDVRALHAQAEAAIWTERAVSSPPPPTAPSPFEQDTQGTARADPLASLKTGRSP
jgi:hypothetical protein